MKGTKQVYDFVRFRPRVVLQVSKGGEEEGLVWVRLEGSISSGTVDSHWNVLSKVVLALIFTCRGFLVIFALDDSEEKVCSRFALVE